MNDFVQMIRSKVNYDARSVHYNKRKSDGMYEIVARTEVDGTWREVCLVIQPSRTKALEVVRYLRGHKDNDA